MTYRAMVWKAVEAEAELKLTEVGVDGVDSPDAAMKHMLDSGWLPRGAPILDEEWYDPHGPMSFAKAMRYVQMWCFVRRASWSKGAVIYKRRYSGAKQGAVERIEYHNGHLGEPVDAWQPSQEDMVASDWELTDMALHFPLCGIKNNGKWCACELKKAEDEDLVELFGEGALVCIVHGKVDPSSVLKDWSSLKRG